VTADESFVFVQDLGGWDGPTHTTTIDGSRRVRHVYTYEEVEGGKLVRRGREVRFELTAGELDELVRTLNRERFLALAMKYDSGDSDGGWWIFEVRTGGKSKFVTAKNTYPGPLVRIATFVKERIIDARPELEAKSGLLSGLPSSLGRQERYAGCDPKVGLEGPLADGVCMLRTFTVRLHAHPSLPPGASYQVSVFDRSAKNALVTREKGTFGNFRAREVDVELTLERTFELDEGHRYEAEVEVTKDGRVTHRAAAPIFTYGAPDAVELQLVPSEPL
jgi:hypothetical protein